MNEDLKRAYFSIREMKPNWTAQQIILCARKTLILTNQVLTELKK